MKKTDVMRVIDNHIRLTEELLREEQARGQCSTDYYENCLSALNRLRCDIDMLKK